MLNTKHIIGLVNGCTLVPPEGIALNISSIDYINTKQGSPATYRIPGAIVECGVWKGGSMASMLYRMQHDPEQDRDVYLFDTFAGMTEPTIYDTKIKGQAPAIVKFNQMQQENYNSWCYASLNEVKRNIQKTRYRPEKITFVVGDVVEQLPIWQEQISEIALLRIDVDFYQGTKACLESLYPNVAKGGVVIFDDYGIWSGAKKAVDEYMIEHKIDKQLLRNKLHLRYFYKP